MPDPDGVHPDYLDRSNDSFGDFEDDGPDDAEAIAAYGRELTEAVEALGIEVKEPGEFRDGEGC